MTQCLLVDDDAGLNNLLHSYLSRFGMTVNAVTDGAGMRRALQMGSYDVLLLDLELPDADGLVLCQWVKLTTALPIIILSGLADPSSRVVGLEVGADDYVGKPFEPRELVARIRAVTRRDARAEGEATCVVQFSGWRFDPLRRQVVSLAGTVIPLSSAEFRLLSAFVQLPGQVLSRERLIRLTRAPGVSVIDRTVDLAVSRLRQKLEVDPDKPQLIRTLRGAGYLFDTQVTRCSELVTHA